VGGHLKFEENLVLVTIDGFPVLGPVGNELKVDSNTVLITMNGLFNVTSVGGHFKIEDNPILSTQWQAEGLRDAIGVSNIGGNVIINGNGLP